MKEEREVKDLLSFPRPSQQTPQHPATACSAQLLPGRPARPLLVPVGLWGTANPWVSPQLLLVP